MSNVCYEYVAMWKNWLPKSGSRVGTSNLGEVTLSYIDAYMCAQGLFIGGLFTL